MPEGAPRPEFERGIGLLEKALISLDHPAIKARANLLEALGNGVIANSLTQIQIQSLKEAVTILASIPEVQAWDKVADVYNKVKDK